MFGTGHSAGAPPFAEGKNGDQPIRSLYQQRHGRLASIHPRSKGFDPRRLEVPDGVAQTLRAAIVGVIVRETERVEACIGERLCRFRPGVVTPPLVLEVRLRVLGDRPFGVTDREVAL